MTRLTREFHQAVENDDESLLILIGKLIDFLVERVQFVVANSGLVAGFFPAGQFVERDIEEFGNPDNGVEVGITPPFSQRL